MINHIDSIRFLTFVRNDTFSYCDTVSWSDMTVGGLDTAWMQTNTFE